MYNSFKTSFTNFFSDEEGAVTVDWVVLTAGVVVLATVVIQSFSLPMEEVATIVTNAVNNPFVPSGGS